MGYWVYLIELLQEGSRRIRRGETASCSFRFAPAPPLIESGRAASALTLLSRSRNAKESNYKECTVADGSYILSRIQAPPTPLSTATSIQAILYFTPLN